MNIKLIIIVPIIFVLVLSAVLTNFFISLEKDIFEEQFDQIETKIIDKQKENIKLSINNLIHILNNNADTFKHIQKNIIKERTLNSIKLIDSIYKEYSNLSKNEILNKIKHSLSYISSMDKSKYFFIYDMNGICISLPNTQHLEGKNLINLQDIKGQYIVKSAIDIASKGGGYNEWYYTNPNTKEISKKLGYISLYKPLNIFIGTALYDKHLLKHIKEHSQELLLNFKTINNGYIFAYDKKGNVISHINKDLIGVNRWNLKIDNKYPIQNLIKKGEQFGGSYLKKYKAATNPNKNKSLSKISYVIECKTLQWVIGTGFYTDKLYENIKINQQQLQIKFKNNLQNIIFTALLITILFTILLWILLHKISQKMTTYKKTLEHQNIKLNNLNETLEDKIFEKTKEQTILLEVIPISVQGYNIDREVIYWNKKSEEVYGYSAKEAMGKKLEDLIIPEFMKTDVIKAIHNWYKNGIIIPSAELPLIKKDGSTVPIYASHIMIEKKYTTSIMYCMDIDLTLQKESQKKDELLFQQSKMAQMGQMIANISHQWRQPLSVISAAASGIKFAQDLGNLKDENITENMNAIVESSLYLSDTIDIFTNFIKEKKETKEVIIQERIDTTLNIVNSSLQNNYIKLINNIAYTKPIKITMIVGELSQVIINIINNAKDALVDNTNIKNKWIELNLIKENNKITITIEDNGGGIADDILPSIYDPYFTTKHKSQGTGLGLHMSYKIITESLGGKLYVKNTQNGAKFFIEVPL